MESRIQDWLGFRCMRQNVSQTRPDRKKADSLVVYSNFAHEGSVSQLLRLCPIMALDIIYKCYRAKY